MSERGRTLVRTGTLPSFLPLRLYITRNRHATSTRSVKV